MTIASKIEGTFFNLPECHRNRRITGVVIFHDNLLMYGTTNGHFDKRVLAVKSWQCKKNFNIEEET